MLTGQFCSTPLDDGNETFMPFVRVSITYGTHKSIEFEGLIDTGACVNLIAMRAVETMLGISEEDAKKGRKLTISGVGSHPNYAYGFEVDMVLRASSHKSSEPFVLPKATVYVCDSVSLPSHRNL